MSMQSKLNRFKKHLVTEKNKAEPLVEFTPQRQAIQHHEAWKSLQTAPYFYDEEYCLVREVHYPVDQRWGNYSFKELESVMEAWMKSGDIHPLSSHNLSPADLLFFDTETTGLSGGAGNTIFLLGHSQVEEEQVKVKQYFLPGPGSEIAMYHYFLTQVKELKNLVTYNGKSFDWPQVKTRHTLIRDFVPSLPAFGHFDLLHGSRRLWKQSLESVRLSVVEKEILGVEREHDTPGYLAPMLYFQYLKENDPELVKGVMIHNEWDVLSLITLYIHISKILQGSSAVTSIEQYESARWYESAGQFGVALQKYTEMMNGEGSPSKMAKKAAAALYKKMKQEHLAVPLWQELCQNSSMENDEEPFVELAKWHEHQEKDFERALYYAEAAYGIWKRKKRLLKRTEVKEKAAFDKRIQRLRKKCEIT
ncbi:ribonuclease H-like domain-containing protein [Fictibacillus terranigra]|uniref:Ribonuclease H-like domain-containing protein n=1 Tax=Fictibacillus terranigra TaxID=3058424 RepID=A0ABT8E997_9BACL|nr:ribonuclease H-like domain-containing protein [Fictibacillus sp. CENA-BCM004]MDN4074488.1 ribonuclease H-like domain-containing protein [Fictibacillus sp. CENA-BCM004]